MIREERTSFLAGLTLVIYAFIQWIEKGSFLFPFPLNELVVFFVFIYFLFLSKWKINRINSLLGVSLFFKLLSQQLIWSFFLSNESLDVLYSGIWTDLFYLLYAIFWLGFSSFYLRSTENKISYVIIGSILFPFIVGIILNQPIFEVISMLMVYLLAWYRKIDRITKSIIGLIVFLEICKLAMLF
jgi:hypothetical protein